MLDLVQLRSFVALEQMGSFTLAAERLALGQSTVSQHIQRLEASLGRKLVARDTHRVSLTTDGQALLAHARSMLAIDDEVKALFAESSLRGRLRLGMSEDFVTSRLPGVLEDFVRAHPSVELELTVALSGVLYHMQDGGEIDLVLAKRRLGDPRGELVYREPLVWLARDPERVKRDRVLPLIAFPPPSITRSVALEVLDRHRLPWRIVCTCGSLSGLTAAAQAGMGVLVQPRSMAPQGLREIPTGTLPPLEDVEFVLVPSKGADQKLIAALSTEILSKVRTLQGQA
ncbi:LysR family transcriptional regulator [Ensifer sp. T173]|jgi:DNA-binding transcriptional LysR family regulator|uniref:LysR family transcriptional regulator n=1 Tax=Ensifer canadensis TaxID=555315 RepID=A0AAW4FMS5_9HYPH|nr:MULTISPECIES: LysR substrate-binding domain-containing protein [Ensifer]MDP9631303.1 DNA-binding transcriptional LysR family regulator [Ensifer adhaerens]KQW60043.1 LysR family transcriptional regulator [Ensifer sp. Root127]MBD9489679.1 LysR family transcriptional regulator [Ensifer sp. ENS11]MBM3092531.1 LysR family transcriptional regulator [Ensifer canadensis]PSS62359.1 LysR family transcriptional regulator [Ensifer sp. NM-2]